MARRSAVLRVDKSFKELVESYQDEVSAREGFRPSSKQVTKSFTDFVLIGREVKQGRERQRFI